MGLHVLLLQLCCALSLTGHLSQSLAAAPGDAVNDLLEKTTHQVSLLQVATTPYWDRLMKRFTPEYSDSSGVQEIMQAQQRWRRSRAWDKVGTSCCCWSAVTALISCEHMCVTCNAYGGLDNRIWLVPIAFTAAALF